MTKPDKLTGRRLLLLIVIYLAFIALGLPDGLPGAAWPVIRTDFDAPLELLGVLTSVVFCVAAASSFLSARILAKWGTGRVTFFSGLMAALGLIGCALSASFPVMLACTVVLGFGQGAVDTGLNKYVAEHFSSRHMNWLHCFWGLGATGGPLLLTAALSGGANWRGGYGVVAAGQLLLSFLLLCSLFCGLWDDGPVKKGWKSLLPPPGRGRGGIFGSAAPVCAVALFFLYAGLEGTMSSYIVSVLVDARGVPAQRAGLAASVVFGCIMAGRLLSGFIVTKMGNARLIRIGLLMALLGAGLAGVLPGYVGALVGTALFGLGLAPVYPCLMHETPVRFPKEVCDRLIGYQVGAACLGGSVLALATGFVLSRVSPGALFPLEIAYVVAALALNAAIERMTARR